MMPSPTRRPRTRTLAIVAALATFAAAPAAAVDSNEYTSAAPDLTSVRAKLKAKDFQGALAEIRPLADKHQHADVYNLLGFALRKTGDYATALTYYKKALDYDQDHKGALEYLGELYVETGQMAKAKEKLAKLVSLCPNGCEEREDLEEAIAAAERK